MTRSDKGEIWIEGRSILINHDYSLIIHPRLFETNKKERNEDFLGKARSKEDMPSTHRDLALSIARTFRFKESFPLFAFSSEVISIFKLSPSLKHVHSRNGKHIPLIYLAQDAHFQNEEWNPFAYLYVIRVEFSARQAVEGAEVQATREDSIRTAALPATKTCQC